MKLHYITMLSILIVLIAGCASQYDTSKLPQKYKEISSHCDSMYVIAVNPDNKNRVDAAYNCCIRSVFEMANKNYEDIAYNYSTDMFFCPDGYTQSKLDCEGSLTWCQKNG